MSEATIKVLDIQRLSTEDGPGLRTTAFVKGCPLRCTWCANPETQSFQPELAQSLTKCTGDDVNAIHHATKFRCALTVKQHCHILCNR